MTASITEREYGRLPDGRAVREYRLDNGAGLVLTALDLGATVTRLEVPDANGAGANVVLGLPALADYLRNRSQLGNVLGRYANRIANARFELDGQVHQLDANDGAHCLHGGRAGFGTRLWQAAAQGPDSLGRVVLLLRYASADGEMGFPGELEVYVRYTLARNSSWRIDYEARTSAPTVVNLSSHAYFNLSGGARPALDQQLQIHASRYTPVDAGRIPIEHRDVGGTPFDFRALRTIGTAADHDHNYMLDEVAPNRLSPVARLADPGSGRVMELLSTAPAVQLYSAFHLNGSLIDAQGRPLDRSAGICLETQFPPDAPNRAPGPDWPSTVLRPGEVWRSSTVHRFGLL
ncbi:MAG: galactose mutarotase [Pelomonas sp.]|nr:galactose mutarotase [Roseateles sp.]